MFRPTDINIWISSKYQNTVIPYLPERIYLYLLTNPEDVNLFVFKKMNINDLLDYIYIKLKENNKEFNLIQTVKEYLCST